MNDAEDLVRRVMDAHNTGAHAVLDAFEDCLSSNFEFRPITVGTERVTYRGREGVEHYYRERAEVFGAGELHIRSLEALGEAVVVQARSTARGRASGATVEEDISLVYWCRDGRLVRLEAFRSHQAALEAARV
jgi:ketosteroid isomerase-like protein